MVEFRSEFWNSYFLAQFCTSKQGARFFGKLLGRLVYSGTTKASELCQINNFLESGAIVNFNVEDVRP
jgi:hypothetical protein